MRSTRTAVGALIVALFLVLGASAAQAQGQYNGDDGPLDTSGTATPGGSITISGACYAANADVEISVDGTVVKTVKADADGRFSTSVTIPANATGSVVIRASGLTSDGATCVLSTTVQVSAAGTTARQAPSSSGGTRLPVTGTEVTPGFVITALVLLAVGGAMVLIARRRRTTSA